MVVYACHGDHVLCAKFKLHVRLFFKITIAHRTDEQIDRVQRVVTSSVANSLVCGMAEESGVAARGRSSLES